MMSLLGCALFASGTGLASRSCHTMRLLGALLIVTATAVFATPALADEHVLARDNSEVQCTVSKTGLTRISLADDRFASVSKLTTGIDAEDFTVVNEPTRGDIYLSVPETYQKSTVSFFGTTAKGYVYKFACRLTGDDAQQVFVENKDIIGEKPAEVARAGSPEDSSAALVQAMYQNASLDGFDIRQPVLAPVMVGSLEVQMISEYRGLNLAGRVLRIENKGKAAVALDETVIAPSGAVAVSVANPDLKPGAATTAYIVTAMEPGIEPGVETGANTAKGDIH